MVTMDGFDHILNWTLKVGSHPFPGQDGGTCINEAALVAAGFEYQPVRRVEDMPDCFSRPICRLAMGLNDEATDAERQRLLPFVTRLACADTPEVEHQRAVYIHARSSYPFTFPFTFQEGLAVLKGALAIGRQADALGPDTVKTRMGPCKVGRPRTRRFQIRTTRSCPRSRAGLERQSRASLPPESRSLRKFHLRRASRRVHA
jgi:hypothetical protein